MENNVNNHLENLKANVYFKEFVRLHNNLVSKVVFLNFGYFILLEPLSVINPRQRKQVYIRLF